MALNGIEGNQVKDAAWAVQSVTGASSYIYGVQYDHAAFKKELAQIVEHVRSTAAHA